MSLTLLLPVVVACAAGASASVIQQRLRPELAAPALTAVAVATALAVAWALAVVVLGTLAEVPWVAERVGWCHHFHRRHRPLPWIAGPVSAAWLAAASARVILARRRHRRLIAIGSDGPPLQIIPSPEPSAYTLPGRPGRLIVTTGMLDALSVPERRVLFAHERSHIRHRHTRYLYLTQLAIAVLPFLTRLGAQVRFATERWADEDAAAELGDRRLVARALGRAALAQNGGIPDGALAAAGPGVVDRMDALLADRKPPFGALCSLGGVGLASVVALGGSTVQLHHLVDLADHVCRI